MTDQKKTQRAEGRQRLNRFLALHQPHCWLFIGGSAVVGALAILRFFPTKVTEFSILLALLLYAVYLFCMQSPLRALNGVMQGLTPWNIQEAFGFVWRLEKSLPALKRREMAFSILTAKAVLLTRIGKFDEAISLVRSFDQVWNEDQRESLNSLMRQIEEVKESIQQKRKEEN